jgi:subtilisin-like proprotein convertase family protein
MLKLVRPLFRFPKSPGIISTLITGLLLLMVPIVQAASFTFDDTAAPSNIPDDDCGSPVIRTVNVPTQFTITDLNFGFNATHSYRGDIKITLQSPQGTSVVVVTDPLDLDGNGNYAVLLDDASANPLNDGNADVIPGTAPFYPRTAAPSNPLSAFNGEKAQGDWKIQVCDAFAFITGTFDRSSLQFTGNAPAAVGGVAEVIDVPTASSGLSYLAGMAGLVMLMGAGWLLKR